MKCALRQLRISSRRALKANQSNSTMPVAETNGSHPITSESPLQIRTKNSSLLLPTSPSLKSAPVRR
jgi:hypothetical protein